MDIHKVHVTGAAVGALLQTMATIEQDFDGLLLGVHETRTVSTLHDDKAEETSLSLEPRVTSFQCHASVCSFYNPAGQIDGEKLAEMVYGRDETVLGWFVSRRDVSAIPSMRDRAVCAALPISLARLQPQADRRPLLFGVFGVGADHNGATIAFQQRLYQQRLPAQDMNVSRAATADPRPQQQPKLLPVSMSFANLGSGKGSRDRRSYEPLASVGGLPSVTPPVQLPKQEDGLPNGGTGSSNNSSSSSSNKGPMAMSEQDLNHIAVTDVQRQVEGVETVYQALMSQVALVTSKLGQKSEELDGLRQEVKALL